MRAPAGDLAAPAQAQGRHPPGRDHRRGRRRRKPGAGVAASLAKGRTRGDAPEIDGTVHVASRRPLRRGEIATVKIERADEYDLHGTAVGY